MGKWRGREASLAAAAGSGNSAAYAGEAGQFTSTPENTFNLPAPRTAQMPARCGRRTTMLPTSRTRRCGPSSWACCRWRSARRQASCLPWAGAALATSFFSFPAVHVVGSSAYGSPLKTMSAEGTPGRPSRQVASGKRGRRHSNLHAPAYPPCSHQQCAQGANRPGPGTSRRCTGPATAAAA